MGISSADLNFGWGGDDRFVKQKTISCDPYLEGGETIDDFLEGFPTVSREQVIAFLEAATERELAAGPEISNSIA